MADGERRMLFDIRGRRKHVVRVVYAILALLMGASLFLVVGPVNIGNLLNNAESVNRNTQIFDEQAEKAEQKLRKEPQNSDLLVALTRARINAGRGESEVDPTTGEQRLTPKGRDEYKKAEQTWNRYLKQVNGKPNPALASLISGSLFLLAQNSRGYPEAIEFLEAAADAQRVATESRPSVGSLMTLSAYEYLAGNKKAGAKAGAEAKAMSRTKSETKQIEKQLTAFEKQSKEIQKAKKEAAKSEKGKGKEALENPLGGLSGSSPTTLSP